MKDDFRLEFIEDTVEMRGVTDVAPDVAHVCGESGENEVVALVFRVERISGNLRAEFAEPEAEPRAFESGVSGDENAFAAEEAVEEIEHVQSLQHFHGGLPESHISLSSELSRSVSIGFQNPVCLYMDILPSSARRSIGARSKTVASPSLM